MQPQITSPLGLVAGNGSFPIELAKEAARRNIAVAAVAHRGETDPELEGLVKSCCWLRVGQLNRMLKFFRQEGVRQATFIGGIRRTRLFSGFFPDWRALKIIAGAGSVRDDAILRGVAGELESTGIEVIAPGVLLSKTLAPPGLLTRRALNPGEARDARIGWEAAKAIGALDIGQTVCVLEGTVVSVESIEGTDRAIQRARELAGRAGVVVKLAKPQQDLRLDLPAVGPGTIETMRTCGASAIVLETSRAMILEPARFVELADQAGIAVMVAQGPLDFQP